MPHRHGRVLGLGRDGGMADELAVERSALVPLPAGVDVSAGSLVEPLACAVHAMARVDLKPYQSVAVVGGGTIGLSAVAAARWIGADVTLSARHDRQRQAGEGLGARIASEGEHDVVVEAAGTERGLRHRARDVPARAGRSSPWPRTGSR